jgi:hypothetical protein
LSSSLLLKQNILKIIIVRQSFQNIVLVGSGDHLTSTQSNCHFLNVIARCENECFFPILISTFNE